MNGWWIAGVVVVGLLAALLLYWLLVTTEGVYLGRRVVVWLYDLTAHRYDGIKAFDPEWEQAFLARPLLRELADRPAPLVLDVATGTGRLPALLLAEPMFNGRCIGLEPAGRMLALAAAKLQPFGRRAGLIRALADPLPFGDGRFDAVACLEALEFMPSDVAALREIARVLRPDGVLLITRRTGPAARAFLGRYRSRQQLAAQLEALGFGGVTISTWQIDYDLVLARKGAVAGQPQPNKNHEPTRQRINR